MSVFLLHMVVMSPALDGRWYAGEDAVRRHPSLDERFDPAVRIVDYDPAWPALADAELRRMRTHADEATGYAALKRQAVGRHPQGRLADIEGKDAYVTALDERAVAWARSRG